MASTLTRPVPRPFHPRLYQEPKSWLVVRRVLFTLFGIHMVLATISGYRAIVQIKSLDLSVGKTVRQGSVVRASMVSWARTYANLRVMIVQGARAETLATVYVPGNVYGGWDFRTRRGDTAPIVSAEHLKKFNAGPAIVRATATGASQWLRVPPPLVRDVRVQLEPSP